MKTKIEQLSRKEASKLISSEVGDKLSGKESEAFDSCLIASVSTWVCHIEGKLIAMWGVVPPTLLSDSAYLWLYTLETIKEYEFLAVRWSQRAVEEVLRKYPVLVGHVSAESPKSIRWIKWLGAEFGQPNGKFIPFAIRRKEA